MLGNRGGVLHDDRREIVRPFKSRQWIACLLEFKDRHRTVMTPNRYTELFFLDEAAAFAAGHRPCAECRRERFRAFQAAWGRPARAPEIDAELHPARIDGKRRKVTYEAELNSLPNGSFVHIDGSPYLVWDDGLFLWTPEQYTREDRRPDHRTVTVLTPEPIVRCFRNGYQPETHGSLRALRHSAAPKA
jgi:hypothetical protein